MPLSLAFQLRVEERGEDRIVVSVWLAPTGDAPARIEGVALQLVARTGEPLGVRMLLPIAGALSQPMRSTVELRVPDAIPLGSKVVGTAWDGAEQREASIPTDPFTTFEVHVRSRRRVLPGPPGDEHEIERLLPEERARIAADYPWIEQPRIPPPPVAELTVVDTDDDQDEVDDLVDDLGLDPDSADWLKELLSEDEVG